jgi:RNA polymerase sigma factor (sigma-70 family)
MLSVLCPRYDRGPDDVPPFQMSRLAVVGPAATALPAQWPGLCPEPAAAEPLDWDAQMRRYARRVIVTLLARGIPLERAKELAQDAWMRVIQNHRAGKLPELHLPGVVIAQAEFLARDDWRRTSRRQARGMDASAEVDPDASPAPADFEARMDARQQLRAVESVLRRASENARKVFFMTYGSEARPAAEIAEALGLSVQRVRQIACELRQEIRRTTGGP